MPVEVKNPTNGPAIAIYHATLERGVNLAGRCRDHIGIQCLKEIAVDRCDANFLTTQIGFVDFFVGVNVKGLALNGAGQILHIAFFIPHFVDGVKGAVFALFGHWNLGQLEKVRFWHHIGIKSASVQGHVHHTRFHGIAHFKSRNGFGAANEVDL